MCYVGRCLSSIIRVGGIEVMYTAHMHIRNAHTIDLGVYRYEIYADRAIEKYYNQAVASGIAPRDLTGDIYRIWT